MYPLELIQSARMITDVCLEIAPGEDVLCIADTGDLFEARFGWKPNSRRWYS
jgi:hypothetical protein